jgi:hypothetical protein
MFRSTKLCCSIPSWPCHCCRPDQARCHAGASKHVPRSAALYARQVHRMRPRVDVIQCWGPPLHGGETPSAVGDQNCPAQYCSRHAQPLRLPASCASLHAFVCPLLMHMHTPKQREQGLLLCTTCTQCHFERLSKCSSSCSSMSRMQTDEGRHSTSLTPPQVCSSLSRKRRNTPCKCDSSSMTQGSDAAAGWWSPAASYIAMPTTMGGCQHHVPAHVQPALNSK